MKPIRATYNYKVTVDCDYTNPLHEKYIGMDYAIEDRQMSGFITDIIRLDDSMEVVTEKETSVDDNNRPVVKEKRGNVTTGGVYVIFWADKGDRYQLMVEDYSKFTVSEKEMRNYVAAYHV